MRIIVLALLSFTFSITGCVQFTKTDDEPERKSNQESSTTSTIDAEKAREFSDSLARDIIEDREKDIYAKLEKAFREAVAEKDVKQNLEKIYAQYGKPLEAEYKMVEMGSEMFNGQKRPIRKYWYAVKTSKAEKGTYFLFTNVVSDGGSLATSGFAIVNFPLGKIPSQLK